MTKLRHSSAAWLTTVLLIGLAACGNPAGVPEQQGNSASATGNGKGKGAAADSREYAAAAGTGSNSTDAGTSVTKLQDAQISSVLSTINAAGLEQSSVASDKAEVEAVRQLARDIGASALAAQGRLTSIASGTNARAPLNIGEAENPFAEQLQADSMRNMALLKRADAARFDGLYLQTQIDLQRQVLVLIDQTLAPSVQNPLLRAEVERTRGDSIVFLQRAQTLKSVINLDSDAGVSDTDAGS